MLKEETELLKQSQQGNTEAFGELMRIYQSRIYALCLRTLRKEHDAYDATQESMIKMFRSIRKFRMESSFSTWMYRICVNTCLDMLRKQRRKRVESLDALRKSGQNIRDLYDLDAAISDKEAQQVLTYLLSRLSISLRQIFVLREMEGLGYEEIADVMQIPIGTVKSRLYRARSQMGAQYNRLKEEEQKKGKLRQNEKGVDDNGHM